MSIGASSIFFGEILEKGCTRDVLYVENLGDLDFFRREGGYVDRSEVDFLREILENGCTRVRFFLG